MRAPTEALVLLAVCLLLYVVGTADVPFYTRGEPREGLVVQEMLRTGEWLVPSRPGEPARKPPLFYWAAATAVRSLPERPEQALRLPSGILGAGGVLATWAMARRAFGPPAGLPAGLVLATAFEWSRAAVAARVDMALAASLTLVLVAWVAMLAGEKPERRWMALATLGVTAGTLAKGPVALVLPALAAAGTAVRLRDLGVVRRLRVPEVLTIAAVLAGLWYVAAFARHGAAFLDVVALENWRRFGDADEVGAGHVHGVPYLLGVGLLGLLPWTPLLPLAAAPLRTQPRPAAVVLAAAWVLAVVGFFAVSSGKRSVYLLPAYPAVALLVGAAVARPPDDGRVATLARRAAQVFVPALVLAALGVGLLALGPGPFTLVGPWLAPEDAAGTRAGLTALAGRPALSAGLGVVALAAAFVIARRRGPAWRRLVLALAVFAVVWTAAFNTIVHPAVGRAESLADFMRQVDRLVPPDATLHALYPIDPRMRFYSPRPFAYWPQGGLATAGYAFLWEDEWKARVEGAGVPLEALAVSRLRNGRRGRLVLTRVPPRASLRDPAAVGPPRPPGLRRDTPRP